jgi:cytochrome c-type biogenesis protein CcmH/NrfG
MADRRVRDYLGRRPADPEGWLLAAWCALTQGDAEAAAGLARHAIALDPDHAAVREAVKALTGSPAPAERAQ